MDIDKSIPAFKQQKLLKRLLAFALPYKHQLILALGIAIVSSVLIPLRPRLIKYGVDTFIATKDFYGLLQLCAVIVLLLLLHGSIQYILSMYMQRIGQRILYDIRMKVFDHIYSLPTRYFDTTPVGRLVTRVTNDVEALNELFTSGVVMIISDALVLLWIVVFMVSINWKLALVTVMVVPVLLYAAFLFRAKVRTVYGKIRVEIARMNSFLSEYINGIQTVQLFHRQAAQSLRFDAINKKHTDLQIQSITYYAVFFPVVELLASVAICLVLFYSVGLSAMNEISAGTLVAFVMYAELFFRPIRDLTEKYNTLQSAVTASERIFEVLDESALQDTSTLVGVSLNADVRFQNVAFSYTTDKPVLHDVSFTVQKGTMMAIVGATGSGKSTIINLLCKFYKPQSGSISIGGSPIDSIADTEYRKHIALVQQDIFLFSRSLYENVRMGREWVSREDVMRVLDQIGADYYKNLPDGLDTVVSERGTTLSTGQKQLIAFARALVGNPEILILDEATANIDSNTESMIERALTVSLEGRTSIVIAHRLATIQRADSILVMHHGTIAEQGRHEELLKSNGLYARLHAYQFLAA